MTEEQTKSSPKTAARPGSAWATGKRKQQKGKTEPKGFSRGAKVK